jgi:D-amino-acid dehydrogenase
MLGLSLAAGTGKIVTEIIDGKKPSIDISSFSVERF